MPTYEFKCTKCRHEWEKFQGVNDPFPSCPECGNQHFVGGDSTGFTVERLISCGSFVLKGTGWSSDGYSG
jgi:putative FmdB family regulatory protein